MFFKEFKEKYLGKTTPARRYWHQCVDLIRHYLLEVFDINYGSYWNAKDYFWNLPEKDFLKIKFSWNFKNCQIWDIIIWDKSKGWWYWHIWIITEVWDSFVSVLEQNWQSWNWDWKNGNEIRIKKFTNFSWIIWFCRHKNFEKYIEKKEVSEFDLKIEKAKNLGIFNWKDINKAATRWEVALMCLKVLEILENKK